MDERRKFPRLNWSVEVHWKLVETSRPAAQDRSVTKDISAGGIRLILREGVQIGDILELDIRLGGGKDVCARGRIAWMEKFAIVGGKESAGYEGGIEFIDMPEATRRLIDSFILEVRT